MTSLVYPTPNLTDDNFESRPLLERSFPCLSPLRAILCVNRIAPTFIDTGLPLYIHCCFRIVSFLPLRPDFPHNRTSRQVALALAEVRSDGTPTTVTLRIIIYA